MEILLLCLDVCVVLGQHVASREFVFQFANGNNILEETLAELSKSEYTWEELLQRPLPDGVDPTKLESYLSDKDFEVLLASPAQYSKICLHGMTVTFLRNTWAFLDPTSWPLPSGSRSTYARRGASSSRRDSSKRTVI